MLENIYRCVNIALINELKLLFEQMKVDTWEVVKAASTKAIRLHTVLSGPWSGWTLYSDRPLLPHLEGALVRFSDTLH